MLLRNLYLLGGGETVDIQIKNRRIEEVSNVLSVEGSGNVLDFEGAIVFPGLINSHDHLDFNLFPQLGTGLYDSYVAWGNDIHKCFPDVINRVQAIPLGVRTQWGIYKNLINGVTTVVNHGRILNPGNNIINVFEKCQVIHSVQFEKYWRLQLNRSFFSKLPVVMHVGEGVSASATNEIDHLIKWNFFRRDLIGVHGVAMNENQASYFKGLVWCPASNFFMMGSTAQVDKLKNATNLVFGTDSTLSAEWNLWEHLRMALRNTGITGSELYYMLTKNAAALWKFGRLGEIARDYDADIVVAKRKNEDVDDTIRNLNPEHILMVLSKGRVKLFDDTLLAQLKNLIRVEDFCRITVNGISKYVYGDLKGLINQVKSYYSGISLPIEVDER